MSALASFPYDVIFSKQTPRVQAMMESTAEYLLGLKASFKQALFGQGDAGYPFLAGPIPGFDESKTHQYETLGALRPFFFFGEFDKHTIKSGAGGDALPGKDQETTLCKVTLYRGCTTPFRFYGCHPKETLLVQFGYQPIPKYVNAGNPGRRNLECDIIPNTPLDAFYKRFDERDVESLNTKDKRNQIDVEDPEQIPLRFKPRLYVPKKKKTGEKFPQRVRFAYNSPDPNGRQKVIEVFTKCGTNPDTGTDEFMLGSVSDITDRCRVMPICTLGPMYHVSTVSTTIECVRVYVHPATSASGSTSQNEEDMGICIVNSARPTIMPAHSPAPLAIMPRPPSREEEEEEELDPAEYRRRYADGSPAHKKTKVEA